MVGKGGERNMEKHTWSVNTGYLHEKELKEAGEQINNFFYAFGFLDLYKKEHVLLL